MAANAKYELSSASPEDSGFAGNYTNGPRGSHTAAKLDKIGSFREKRNGHAFSSGASVLKGKVGDLPPLSKCLMLEPITLGEQNYTRSGELRRALGFSFSSISEDNTFSAAHSKPAPGLATDELKRFRGSVQDGSNKARMRVKKLDDSLNKLTVYLRKQQINERSGGPNLLKTAQTHRKSPDLMMQKMDDRGKNTLSKRARTPVADMRVEARGTGILRQHMILGKEKDVTKQGNLNSDSVEEKIRRLPAGGEGWDKKMKRKRSVSNVFPRHVDANGEIKRAMHGRLSSDSGMPSSDAPAFRSVSSSSVGGNTKPDGILAAGSSVQPAYKNEMGKVSFSRELGGMSKESILQKGNNKLNMRDENHLASPSLITKGKASRASRAGPPTMGSSSPSHMPSTPEDWVQPLSVNKMHLLGGINNRKQAFSGESSSPPMAQWVGQRPQKISRIRRTNIISPTSNNDEAVLSSEGCGASDYGVITSGGFNGPFSAQSIVGNPQHLKVKSENTPSPARLLESEETGAVENRLKEREDGSVVSEERDVNGYQQNGSTGLLTKKNKLLGKEEIGDGVRRQGCSGRGSTLSRGSMSSLGEKLDSPTVPKPLRSAKPGSDKNGSKSGRPPLKKHSERKGFTRLGLVPNGHSPDIAGESDDDREDLFAAAQFICNANYHACSSSFWKKMEPLFAVRADDKSYLIQQKDILKEEKLQPRCFGSEGESVVMSDGIEPTKTKGLVNLCQDSDFSYRRDFEGGPNDVTPLYQRVLSALIVEDELEEFEQNNCRRNAALFSGRDSTCSMEENIFYNGGTAENRCSSTDDPPRVDLLEGDYSFMHSDVGIMPASSQSKMNGPFIPQINLFNYSGSEGQYVGMSIDEKLLAELQSIGLYPETVPDLAEGEDEILSKEILQLEKQFHQEADKKKLRLERIWKAVEEEKDLEERDLEQVAMSRLVVLAYKKLLATRGSTAAKMGISKVPKHVALAFVKRTLARCRKFEDTGKSCFSEPALRDVILSGPLSCTNAEITRSFGLTDHNVQSEAKAPGSYTTGDEQRGLHNDKPERILVESYDPPSHQSDHPFAKNGPILNGGKKKEILLDDGAVLKSSSLGITLVGGVKGKRSERDRDKNLLSRNSNAKSGRPSTTNVLGERKAKSKPKQRAAHLTTRPVFPSASISGEMVANGGSRKGEDLTSPSNALDSSKEGKDPVDTTNLPLHALDSIELGVDNDFCGNQDLSSWFSIVDDNLQDDDFMGGLDIPMDDLNMVL